MQQNSDGILTAVITFPVEYSTHFNPGVKLCNGNCMRLSTRRWEGRPSEMDDAMQVETQKSEPRPPEMDDTQCL